MNTRINQEFNRIAVNSGLIDGTTAVVALIHGRRIVVANGDS